MARDTFRMAVMVSFFCVAILAATSMVAADQPNTGPIQVSDLSLVTVLIENEEGSVGTGFLVGRQLDKTTDKVFLVTNKHVLHPDSQGRTQAHAVRLHLNARTAAGEIAAWNIVHPLRYDDGRSNYKEHPDRDVDVLAIDITNALVANPQLERKYLDYSLFLTEKVKIELNIGAGDEILVLGYPLGLRHRKNNFPLVRAGIIATRLGEELEDEARDGLGTRKRVLRGFLYDGASIPGSSGSPVFFRPRDTRRRGDAIAVVTVPPYLVGIVAETRYAPIRTPTGDIPSFAGLGLAFDVTTVKETIEMFFRIPKPGM